MEVLRKAHQYSLDEKGIHDSMWSGGHLGRDKTIDKIKDIFYFKNLHRYVDLWISSCSVCRATKRKQLGLLLTHSPNLHLQFLL